LVDVVERRIPMHKQGILLSIIAVLLLSLWSLTLVGLPYGPFDWTAYSQPYVTQTPTATIEPTITLTPTPTEVATPTALVYLPLIRRSSTSRSVSGWIRIEGGGCCYYWSYPGWLPIRVSLGATSPVANVTKMRLEGRETWRWACTSEEEMGNIPWEPFASEKTMQVWVISAHVAGVRISVQYQDALGNLSPVYCDWKTFINPTPTAIQASTKPSTPAPQP